LDQCDRTRLCRLFVVACFLSDMGGKCAIHNTQYFSHDVEIAGKQKPKLKREAQYPLPNGLMGQHIINQQGGAFCHSPRTATAHRPTLYFFVDSQYPHHEARAYLLSNHAKHKKLMTKNIQKLINKTGLNYEKINPEIEALNDYLGWDIRESMFPTEADEATQYSAKDS